MQERCASSSSRTERSLFASVIVLGALFGLMASPCARTPLLSSVVLLGVPIMTFAVAAPSRLGLRGELSLLWGGTQALFLGLLLRLAGRPSDAARVKARQHRRVENAYLAGDERFQSLLRNDVLRLHHMRRLGAFGASLAVCAGLSLPFLRPEAFTNGDFPSAFFVLLLDVTTFGLIGRIVTERIMGRLFEAAVILAGGHPWTARVRVVPLLTILGAALGAVGSLVIINAAAVASAVETTWFADVGFTEPAFWYIRQTASMGLALGIGAGAILGMGAGLAQPPELRTHVATPTTRQSS